MHLLDKHLKGHVDVPIKTRTRTLRLIENMTLDCNAMGCLTKSMHSAGYPQAQRIQIAWQSFKKDLAQALAGVLTMSVKTP